MTSCLETEWDYSGRKGRDGQKKKIGKANEKKEEGKSKEQKVNGHGEKGRKWMPRPHAGHRHRRGCNMRHTLLLEIY